MIKIQLDVTNNQPCHLIWNGKLNSKHLIKEGNNTLTFNFNEIQDTNDFKLFFLENTGQITINDLIVEGMSFEKSRYGLSTHLIFDTCWVSLNGNDVTFENCKGHILNNVGYFGCKMTYPLDKWFFKTWVNCNKERYK